MNSTKPISQGQRFVKTEAPRTVWVVGETLHLHSRSAHVSIYRENDPSEQRTIALSALGNPRHFLALGPAPGDATATLHDAGALTEKLGF